MYIHKNVYYFDVIECIRLVINKKANNNLKNPQKK